MVQKLFTICEITETASEDEAEVAILNTELFKFSFDTQSHKVIDIDPIHIYTYNCTVSLYQHRKQYNLSSKSL